LIASNTRKALIYELLISSVDFYRCHRCTRAGAGGIRGGVPMSALVALASVAVFGLLVVVVLVAIGRASKP
jgi:hypothetical protein